MSSCRGIVIAGVTNQARTQMAEGFLRAFTRNALFICSGALQHGGCVHPLAIQAMSSVGVDISQQTCSSLEGARRQRATYDVYIGIDDSYVNRSSDHYQQRHFHLSGGDDVSSSMKAEGSVSDFSAQGSGEVFLSGTAASSRALYSDPLLASAVPSHWAVAQDTTDSRQSWTLWSPRDPSIFHENSTRKFQDHLYEGEPLFMTVKLSELRRHCRVQRRWEMPAVVQRYAMETGAEQLARVVQARDRLAPLCVQLIGDLEKMYGESLLDAEAVKAYEAAVAGNGAAKNNGAESAQGF